MKLPYEHYDGKTIKYPVTPDMMAEATAHRAADDKKYNEDYGEALDPEASVLGYASELSTHQYFDLMGIPHEWITEDTVGKPDFLMRKDRIDQKIRKLGADPKPEYRIHVPAYQRYSKANITMYLFSAFRAHNWKDFSRGGWVYLLGFMRKAQFCELAELHCAGYRFAKDGWTVPPGHDAYFAEMGQVIPFTLAINRLLKGQS